MNTSAPDITLPPGSDLYHQALLAAAQSVIIADNRAGDVEIVFSNPAFEELTGYKPDETLGRNCRFLQGEDTCPNAIRAMSEAVRSGKAHQTVLRNYRRDGVPFWNQVTIAPLRDLEGRTTHFVGIQADVSAVQEASEERRRLETEVAQAQASQFTCLRDILHSVTENRFHLCRAADELPGKAALRFETSDLGPDGMRGLRRAVLRESDDIAMPPDRSDEFVVAVGEAATNAVVHGGGGRGEVRTDGKFVQVWIHDRGPGIRISHLHRAILERGFSTGGTMGYGYWVIIRTCDQVWLHTGPEGTTVVLQQGIKAAPPLWFGGVKDTVEGQFGSGKLTAAW